MYGNQNLIMAYNTCTSSMKYVKSNDLPINVSVIHHRHIYCREQTISIFVTIIVINISHADILG